ncbi:MAG TPA: MBL fold metallo-hydrolase [Kofleriaceae bacterium]|jgi:L-ascorbate metabolism protein UlaG (beta-lactamase superfamily)
MSEDDEPAPDSHDHRKSAGLRRERALASSQWDGARFANPSGARDGVQGGALPLLGEWMFGGQERRPRAPLPVERPLEAWAKPPETGFRATWLGHSTVLLELDGVRVLTDPVFGERVSPIGFVGPRRFHPVPAALDELPPLDAVLLSHDHYDHLCRETMTALAKTGVPIVTALGVGAHLEKFGWDPAKITELDWWEHVRIGGVELTAAPSQHFSGRSLRGRNRTLWASWRIRTEQHSVYFSGDTGLTPDFETIAARLGPFDLVMLEIGAYHPRWGTIHLGPANALEAFRMLGGGTLLPVHWGTFSLGLHAWDAPGEELIALADTAGARILTPKLGAAFEPSRVDGPTPWWREVPSKARERALLVSPAS